MKVSVLYTDMTREYYECESWAVAGDWLVLTQCRRDTDHPNTRYDQAIPSHRIHNVYSDPIERKMPKLTDRQSPQ